MLKTAQLAIAFSVAFGAVGYAQTTEGTGEDASEPAAVPITIDNLIRAASDIEFQKYTSLAGGTNRFFHFREPTPVDNQPTIRMNRDTLYSTAVVNISKGATLTLPDVGGRYMTAMVVNQDHYINDVFHGGGTYTLDQETFDTPYVLVFLRILVDAADPEDVAAVNTIQDAMKIEANASTPFASPNYDVDTFGAMVRQLLPLGPLGILPDSSNMFGAREDVHPLRHFLGTLSGWGGLPEAEAFYVGVEPSLPVGAYKIEVPKDVPVNAFWSVSMYNAQGFFEPNAQNAYNVNSVTGARNDNGSMTIHLGACDDGRVNCLPVTDGWNYTIRMYRPGPEILDGSWSFPAAQPAN